MRLLKTMISLLALAGVGAVSVTLGGDQGRSGPGPGQHYAAGLASVRWGSSRDANLDSSEPADQGSLWRTQHNVIRLTFDGNIGTPSPGQVLIQELLGGGGFGGDLSSSFIFSVEDSGGFPRVLRIEENGSVLIDRTWYGIRNTGGWSGVAPFEVQYVVQVGDATGEGMVQVNDWAMVNAYVPNFDALDNDRSDMNGDGYVLYFDSSVTVAKIPSMPVPKPSGH